MKVRIWWIFDWRLLNVDCRFKIEDFIRVHGDLYSDFFVYSRGLTNLHSFK